MKDYDTSYHEGTLHWSCTHEPPADVDPVAYRAGQDAAADEWEVARQSETILAGRP